MSYNSLKSILQTGMFVAVCPIVAAAQPAHETHAHQLAMPLQMTTAPKQGPHGGTLKQSGSLQFESILSQGGIQMFVFDLNGQPLSVSSGRGAATLRIEGNAKRYRYDLLPDGKGGLTAPVNLSQLAGRQIEIDLQLVGLPGIGSQTLNLHEVATIPASEQQLTAAAIARQKICPVSGKPLGSMGTPVAVMVNEQTVYACCSGCVKKIQAEPAKYLALVYGEEVGSSVVGRAGELEVGSVPIGTEQEREGIFKVSAADAPFIAAQKRCPVMDEPLNAMGGPYKVNADGKAIYICCPGCAKKVAAEPRKYLVILKSQGVEAPVLR